MLQLRILGTLDLRSAGGQELRAVLAQPKRLALLVYLAAATPRGFHQRDRLIALFWPEYDTEHARASLSRAIYFLRRELEDGIIITRGDEISVDHHRLWCDAATFEDALRNGNGCDALELYAGDLLPGFFVSGAAGFEDWLEQERTQLRRRASDAAWQLSDDAERLADIALAAKWARRGVDIEPYREAGARRLIALLDRSGDRAAAVQAYRRFADGLATELELSPSPETQALVDEIRGRQDRRVLPPVLPDAVSPTPATISAIEPGPAKPATGQAVRIRAKSARVKWHARTAGIIGAVLVALMSLLASGEAIDPDRIDVSTFENRTGDPQFDRDGHLAAERIASSLRKAGLFRTVATTQRALLFRSISTGDGARTTPTRRRSLVVVTGSISRRGTALVIQAYIADARRRDSVWTIAPVPSASSSFDGAIDQVRQRVMGGVAAMQSQYGPSFFPVASVPPTFEAFQEYTEGVRVAIPGRHREALRHFAAAAALDSAFTWPLVDAAVMCLRLCPPPEADSVIGLVNAMRARLPALQRHVVDYALAARASDWEAIYASLRQASHLAPGRFAYSFAIAATHLNRPRETVEILSAAGMDSAHRNDTKTYWKVLTLALHQLGDYRRELATARRARRYRPASIEAMLQEIRALAALHRTDAVRARLDTLVLLPRDGWLTPSFAIAEAALELRTHNQRAAADDALRLAEALYRRRPAVETETPEARSRLAETLYALGQLDEAERLYRGLAQEDSTDAGVLAALGAIAARRGRRSEAEAIGVRLESLQHFVPVPGDDATLGRAKIAALLGDRDRAVQLLVEAFGPTGTAQLHDDDDFAKLRDDPRFREFVRPKG